MSNAEFHAAVHEMAKLACPRGFEWAPDAPDTFADLKAVWLDGGRMVVTDAWSPEDHPTFADAFTYRAFRAWHDWAHLITDGQFTLEGECRAANFQRNQLVTFYGEAKANEWMVTLHDELIINNFGECAVCEA